MPMIRTRWGRIVNLSSVAAIAGNRGQVNYAAAKGRSTAPPRRWRSSSPAAASPSTRSRPASSPQAWRAQIDPAMIEQHGADEARRQRRPRSAALVAFLASDEAGYISGQVVSINGAMI